ncbi:MAG: EamA/RhaT family transporter, partial [Candidatus Competibacterales bacterium]
MTPGHSEGGLTRWVPFVFVLLWSTGFIGAKFGLPYIEPFYFLFLRMALNVAVFALLIALFQAPWPSLRGGLQQMVVGVLIH